MKIYGILIICMIWLLSCHKPKVLPEPLPPLPNYLWTDYLGTYDVYDTVNHTQWVMKISHLRHSEVNQGNNDSVFIENFANKFTIRDMWFPFVNSNVNKAGFFIKTYHPILDKQGYSWHLGGIGDDAATNIAENIIFNDSIILYFSQSNIAFYQVDGVPYFDCDCKHIAVKRH